jgi:[ribosomal protein S18]-alanine N-acetyltransferase
VAPLLLKAVELVARRRGCTTVRLEVHETNHAAIARYRKQGYEEFGRHSRYYDDGGDALRFHKNL